MRCVTPRLAECGYVEALSLRISAPSALSRNSQHRDRKDTKGDAEITFPIERLLFLFEDESNRFLV